MQPGYSSTRRTQPDGFVVQPTLHSCPYLLPKALLLGWRCVPDKGAEVTIRGRRPAWTRNNQSGIATQVRKCDYAVWLCCWEMFGKGVGVRTLC